MSSVPLATCHVLHAVNRGLSPKPRLDAGHAAGDLSSRYIAVSRCWSADNLSIISAVLLLTKTWHRLSYALIHALTFWESVLASQNVCTSTPVIPASCRKECLGISTEPMTASSLTHSSQRFLSCPPGSSSHPRCCTHMFCRFFFTGSSHPDR